MKKTFGALVGISTSALVVGVGCGSGVAVGGGSQVGQLTSDRSRLSTNTYWWENSECYGGAVSCWATNTYPSAGAFGSRLRYDNMTALPTVDANGVGYGNQTLNADWIDAPATGGDYPWAAWNGPTCSPGVSCNSSPDQFVSQSYFDSNENSWHFAMGGAGQCISDGSAVPCNLGHNFYSYDSSASLKNSPLSGSFNDPNATFNIATGQYVGVAVGAWHGFLCANFVDVAAASYFQLEICSETWRTPNGYPGGMSQISCDPDGNNNVWLATVWVPNGSPSFFMSYPPGNSGEQLGTVGQYMFFGWSMSRAQFQILQSAVYNTCTQAGYTSPPVDTNWNHWKLRNSENGFEVTGAQGYGSGIEFMTWNESMFTQW